MKRIRKEGRKTIKLKDLMKIAGANLYIIDGSTPVTVIDMEHTNQDPVDPAYLEKEVETIGVTDDEISVWLKKEDK